MQILGFVAENFKRLRIVEITPKGRVVQITGKNGQGKTSVLDAVWAGFSGKKGIPDKPVRKGATKTTIKIKVGDGKTGTLEFLATRTIEGDRTTTIRLEKADGTRYTTATNVTPQAILDELMGSFAFDPLEFVNLDTKKQIDSLRAVAKLDVDIDALNEANEKDFKARTIINREVIRLEAEAKTIQVQAGLPKARIDETAISAKLAEAGTKNAELAATIQEKNRLGAAAETAKASLASAAAAVTETEKLIADLEQRLAEAREWLGGRRKTFEKLNAAATETEQAYLAAPVGSLIDTNPILEELEQARLVNRELERLERRNKIDAARAEQQKQADKLTRAIEDRDEKKRLAIAGAKMPVEGLTFDEAAIYVNGIPLEQLGEAEQIRLSTSIAMAANPKLRVLRIMHGEALDDDSLAVLAEMAEAHDFQIWMAKVDSSGKVGIVLEDGMVASDHQEDEASE